MKALNLKFSALILMASFVALTQAHADTTTDTIDAIDATEVVETTATATEAQPLSCEDLKQGILEELIVEKGPMEKRVAELTKTYKKAAEPLMKLQSQLAKAVQGVIPQPTDEQIAILVAQVGKNFNRTDKCKKGFAAGTPLNRMDRGEHALAYCVDKKNDILSYAPTQQSVYFVQGRVEREPVLPIEHLVTEGCPGAEGCFRKIESSLTVAGPNTSSEHDEFVLSMDIADPALPITPSLESLVRRIDHTGLTTRSTDEFVTAALKRQDRRDCLPQATEN